MKFAQLNANRSRAVFHLLWNDYKDCDVLLITEPNKKLVTEKKLICDNLMDAAVAIRSNCDNSAVISVHSGNGYVCVELSKSVVIVCYVSPNVGIGRLDAMLLSIEQVLHAARKPVIISGDLNSKSALWGSPVDDDRGRLVADWL